MKRFIVVVLDGFGIGATQDASKVRPQDTKANTLKSILTVYPDLKLPNLEKLGLMNAANFESKYMKFSETANFGTSKLMHFGADTFMGHQEIMGTFPKEPLNEPFTEKCEEIAEYLESKGHRIEYLKKGGMNILLVDDYVTIGDNIEADFGMVYNVTAPLSQISFETQLEIAKKVRKIAKVNRVIAFGGTASRIEDLITAIQVKDDKYIGVHASNSKSYLTGYECLHLGYGVDSSVQVPTILAKNKITVTLLGKVADIVHNKGGKSISIVDTAIVLEKTIEELKLMDKGFICTNVQQTDLAGHSEDPKWYQQILEIADKKIGELIENLQKEDVLIIMADHGNDPCIGNNKHTREHIPILLYKKGLSGINLGRRNTLSDIGATVSEFFHCEKPQNGSSFCDLIL